MRPVFFPESLVSKNFLNGPFTRMTHFPAFLAYSVLAFFPNFPHPAPMAGYHVFADCLADPFLSKCPLSLGFSYFLCVLGSPQIFGCPIFSWYHVFSNFQIGPEFSTSRFYWMSCSCFPISPIFPEFPKKTWNSFVLKGDFPVFSLNCMKVKIIFEGGFPHWSRIS